MSCGWMTVDCGESSCIWRRAVQRKDQEDEERTGLNKIWRKCSERKHKRTLASMWLRRMMNRGPNTVMTV